MEGDKILKSDEEGGSAYSVTLKWRHLWTALIVSFGQTPPPQRDVIYGQQRQDLGRFSVKKIAQK